MGFDHWTMWLGFGLAFLGIAYGNYALGNGLLSVGFVLVACLHFARAAWEWRGSEST